jgi:FtsP/CotA-like multicopper oxidase with cupredoxin domain
MEDQQQLAAVSPLIDSTRGMNVSPESEHPRQFENYADARSPYMFHCHILEHEDAGMMGQFMVVA